MDSRQWAWRGLPADLRRVLAERLAPAELQSVLMSVAEARAAAVTPARVAQRWRDDAFVHPSNQDGRALHAVDAHLWKLLPAEFGAVELSPVVPLGSSAALAGVHQNRVLATTRTSEVVSDHTVPLALEAARRRRQRPGAAVHLAATHRVLRVQRFPPPYQQHFRLFALVSSDRDRGSAQTEAALLVQHLRFYVSALTTLVPSDPIRLRIACFDDAPVSERVRDTVLPALGTLPRNVEVVDDIDRQRGRGYYRDVAVGIDVLHEGEELEIGDGGFTDWTAKLLSNHKERCLTSCVATERLAPLLATTQN